MPCSSMCAASQPHGARSIGFEVDVHGDRFLYGERGGKPKSDRGTLSFSADKPAMVAIGTNFISHVQAEQNLKQEISSKSFDEVVNDKRLAWRSSLGHVKVDALDQERVGEIYTNLWRARQSISAPTVARSCPDSWLPTVASGVAPDGVHSEVHCGARPAQEACRRLGQCLRRGRLLASVGLA